MGIQPENIFLIRAAASQIACTTRATGLEGRLIEMNGTSSRHAHQRLNPLSQEYSLWDKMTLDFDRIAKSTSVPLISDFHAVAFEIPAAKVNVNRMYSSKYNEAHRYLFLPLSCHL